MHIIYNYTHVVLTILPIIIFYPHYIYPLNRGCLKLC